MQNLVGHKMLLGNGEGKSDVYIVSLDEETNKYILTYYDEKLKGEPLWSADSNRKAVKINISKSPETEMSYAVKLQVTSVEGFEPFAKNEEELAQKISTMGPEKKKELVKQIIIILMNNIEGTNFTTFEEMLNFYNKLSGTTLTEEEFLNNTGMPTTDEDICYSIINLFQDESTGEIKIYEVINPEGVIGVDSYTATENGTYEFTVKDIFTGETYKKPVEVTNIDKSLLPYYVDCESDEYGYTKIYLKDKVNSTKEKFENAYVMYEGKRIDIEIQGDYSDDETNYIRGTGIMSALYNNGYEGASSFEYKDIEVILVKDGIEYKGTVNIGNTSPR